MADMTTSGKGKEEQQNKPLMEKAKDVGFQAADKAREAASSVGHMASQAASSVGHMATDAASSVGHMATDAAKNVGKTADNLTASAGGSIRKLGDTLSATAPREGMLGSASQSVANTIREGGKYIEDAKLSGIAEDVTNLIRRNPMPAILVGIGVGFLLGQAIGRRS